MKYAVFNLKILRNHSARTAITVFYHKSVVPIKILQLSINLQVDLDDVCVSLPVSREASQKTVSLSTIFHLQDHFRNLFASIGVSSRGTFLSSLLSFFLCFPSSFFSSILHIFFLPHRFLLLSFISPMFFYYAHTTWTVRWHVTTASLITKTVATLWPLFSVKICVKKEKKKFSCSERIKLLCKLWLSWLIFSDICICWY